MSLTQMRTDTPIQYKGTGYIHQNEEGMIEFKIYCCNTNTNMTDCLRRDFSKKSGEIFSESDYFQLLAIALDGTTWKAERFLIDASWPTEGKPIIIGRVSELRAEWNTQKPAHSVRIIFFEQANIPCIIDKIEFSTNNCDFTFRKFDNEFVVEAHSGDSLDDYIHIRIQEALRFILAKSVSWRVLERSDGHRSWVELTSPIKRSANTQLCPPITCANHCYIDDSLNLFKLYLDYITQKAPRNRWHACSYHLHNACEASANSIDAWIVGLCVAVEGIVSLIEVERDSEELKNISLLKECILNYIGREEKFNQFKARVKGLLGMLSATSPSDKLNYLMHQGLVARENIVSWKKIRSKHIHPSEMAPRSEAAKDFQLLIDHINGTTTLMYNVIFALIGYRGKFTDYGTRNYPTKEFPLNLIIESSKDLEL